MDPNDLARNLWEHRRPIAVSASTLVASLWILCGVTFEEPDAFLVGAAILTPLIAVGAMTVGSMIPWFHKAAVLAPTPPDDAEAPNP